MTKKLPTEDEIQHGMTLLRDTQNWEGHVAVVPVDPVCRWNPNGGNTVCGDPVQNAVVLLLDKAGDRPKVGEPVQVVVFCEHHTTCMVASVERWRAMD